MLREVFLYDSLFTGSLTPSTEEQLVKLYRPAMRNNCLMVSVRNSLLHLVQKKVLNPYSGKMP